jgi:Lytic transglycolase
MPRLLAAAAMAASIVLSYPPLPASADQSADFVLPGGHFFSQTNQTTLGPRAGGFSIADSNGIPFWTYFNEHGGPDVLGYPVSRRFTWDGYVCQATQRAVMQWNPSTQKVQLANVFDNLSMIGKDQWLATTNIAPPVQLSDGEVHAGSQPVPFPLLAHFRFGWLYNDTSIFHRYFGMPDYYDIYGLPTSSVQDLGPYWAVRFQRVVMYHWKTSVPWADSGGVSVGLAGDLFKELGYVPAEALQLEDSRSPDPGVNLPASIPQPTMNRNLSGNAPTVAPTSPKPPGAPASESRPATASTNLPVLVGVATWYGAYFQGQVMSNGYRYNMYNPTTTAANLYPLGTWLRVTRLTTGRSILVRVTDRGAFRYPDITDLSYSAFSLLGDPSIGVIGVRVEPLG